MENEIKQLSAEEEAQKAKIEELQNILIELLIKPIQEMRDDIHARIQDVDNKFGVLVTIISENTMSSAMIGNGHILANGMMHILCDPNNSAMGAEVFLALSDQEHVTEKALMLARMKAIATMLGRDVFEDMDIAQSGSKEAMEKLTKDIADAPILGQEESLEPEGSALKSKANQSAVAMMIGALLGNALNSKKNERS